MGVGTVITVLSKIPWGQVVDNAPKVADAAAKLWRAVINRRKQDAVHIGQSDVLSDVHPSDGSSMEARVLALEDGVKCLEDQMQASSELIKTLAEQNAKMVQRVEELRARLAFHVKAAAMGGMVLLAVVVYLVLRT